MLNSNKKWIQALLFRHVDKLFYSHKFGSSRRKLTATVLMIIISLFPYLDIFLGFFIDINSIKLNSFQNLGTAIWSFSMCLTPLLLIVVVRLKPYWIAYLVTIYVYLTMFFGFLFLEINFNINSDWIFRLITLSATILILLLSKIIKDYYNLLVFKDEITSEIKKN